MPRPLQLNPDRLFPAEPDTRSMARSAALKLVGDVTDPDNEVSEPSMFLSTLVRRASVTPPRV